MSHREIERKYSVAGATLPELEGLPGVAVVSEPVELRLDATYVDTVDLRLAAHGVTLRRRTGGTDAGWHLKLPVAKDTRDELHAPVGRSARAVPARLADLVSAYARGAALEPVARIRTARMERSLCDETGNVLASVTADQVSAQRLAGDRATLEAWAEIEVELGAGDAGLLDAVEERVLAAGGQPPAAASKALQVLGPAVLPPWPALSAPRPKSPAGAVVAAHLQEHTRALLVMDPRVRLDEHDAVHKMRVASRRLRSALRTMQDLLDPAATEAVGAELRWLAGVLGQVRDGEVLHHRLRRDLDVLAPELVLGPVAARLQTDVLAPTLAAREELLEALRSQRYFDLLDALETLCAEPPLLPAAEERADVVLPALLRKALRRVRRRLAAADAAADPDEAYHEARKAAKRLRYAAEAFSVVLGKRAVAVAERAEALQEVLGEHQDGVLARSELRRLALRADAAGESAFTYGLLVGAELARSTQLEGNLAPVRAGLDDRRLRRKLATR